MKKFNFIDTFLIVSIIIVVGILLITTYTRKNSYETRVGAIQLNTK